MPGAANGPASSAVLKTGSVSRGKVWSAAPYFAWPGCRLLQLPSTVRRPKETSGLSIWLGPVPIIAWQRTGSVESPGP